MWTRSSDVIKFSQAKVGREYLMCPPRQHIIYRATIKAFRKIVIDFRLNVFGRDGRRHTRKRTRKRMNLLLYYLHSELWNVTPWNSFKHLTLQWFETMQRCWSLFRRMQHFMSAIAKCTRFSTVNTESWCICCLVFPDPISFDRHH